MCWAKKGGCGTKFKDGDASIEQQKVGRIENEDIADVWNTVKKMAKKRAHVDVTLTVTAASDIFTQDIEDMDETLRPQEEQVGEQQSESATPKAQQKAKSKPKTKAKTKEQTTADKIALLKGDRPTAFSSAGDLASIKRMWFWIYDYHQIVTGVDVFTSEYFQNDKAQQGYTRKRVLEFPQSTIAFLKSGLQQYAENEGIDQFNAWLKDPNA